MAFKTHRGRWLAVLVGVLATGAAALILIVARVGRSASGPPNIIWVVWDTVRADHLSLYGYGKPTTPHLDAWAKGARVFDDCRSVAPHTHPSHASMFTGLMPSEHGTNYSDKWLDDSCVTVAELLKQHGYQTFLYAANPHISRLANFQQGFEVEEHPWDRKYSAEALRLMKRRISDQDRSNMRLHKHIRAGTPNQWDIKATGEIAQRATQSWLKARDPKRPFFVFLNYMEAHLPYVPLEASRRRMMTPEQIALSYKVDRSWDALWGYCFRLREYSPAELEVTAATYDAMLTELDDLFRNLLEALRASGDLENTVVILTSDHGEQHGEHHLIGHEYSLYEPVLHVPLVVMFPKRFAPGRDSRPVANFDLFPTVLALAGVELPPGLDTKAVNLLTPREDRVRVAEYPAYYPNRFLPIRQEHPDWDSTPWQRTLRSYTAGGYKYIWASNGRNELYDLRQDPEELHDLSEQTDLAGPLAAALDQYVGTFTTLARTDRPPVAYSDDDLRRLASLGYLSVPDKNADGSAPASSPAGDGEPD